MSFISMNKYRRNDITKNVQCLALDIDAKPNRTGKYRIIGGAGLSGSGGRNFLQVSDILFVGQVPRNCLVTDVRILWHKGFPADTKFDFGFLADFPSDALTVTQADIVADDSVQNGTMYINVNNAGAIDNTGTSIPSAEGDYRGALWNGDARPLMLGMNVRSDSLADGVELKEGSCTVLVSFIRFDKADLFDEEAVSTDGFFPKYFVT